MTRGSHIRQSFCTRVKWGKRCLIVKLRNSSCYLCLACQGLPRGSHPPLPRMNVPLFIDRLRLDATRCNSPGLGV